ncbi:MAG: DMT family transporter [Xanthomonadaceae bacterium]|nr:DMT family transporter [Xanthomonadaceae bacterium]
MMGELAAFSASFTWAIGTTVYSQLARKYPAVTVNLARALISFPLFVALAFYETRETGWVDINLTTICWFSVSVICSTAVGDWIFLLATTEIGASLALAIASCYPIYSAIAGVVFRGELLNAMQVLGLVVAVFGIIFVILLGRKISSGGNFKRGIILSVLVSFFWFLNSFAVATAGRGLGAGVANTIRMGLAIVFCVFLGGLVFRVRRLTLERADLWRFGWLFAFEAFLGSYFYVYGLSHTKLAVGAVLSALAPAISVPFAWVAGTERVSVAKLMGVIVVVAGLALLIVG